jgi:hypothetical protein
MEDPIIQDIVQRLERLEKIIGESTKSSSRGINTSVPKLDKAREAKSKRKPVDLTGPLNKLFQDGFFSEWRTDIDVTGQLQIKLLTERAPQRASVVNTLRKMVKTGLLIRNKVLIGKKNLLAYRKK